MGGDHRSIDMLRRNRKEGQRWTKMTRTHRCTILEIPSSVRKQNTQTKQRNPCMGGSWRLKDGACCWSVYISSLKCGAEPTSRIRSGIFNIILKWHHKGLMNSYKAWKHGFLKGACHFYSSVHSSLASQTTGNEDHLNSAANVLVFFCPLPGSCWAEMNHSPNDKGYLPIFSMPVSTSCVVSFTPKKRRKKRK